MTTIAVRIDARSPGRGASLVTTLRLREWWPAWLGAIVTLGLSLYPLTRPHALNGVHGYSGNGYDDGVYLGSAIRLTHGVLPWVDDTFLHPPGITWIMTPFALLGRLLAEPDGLAAARVATAFVAAANTMLAALVVRGRGRTAMSVATWLMAAYPLAVAATHSVMLEPYLVFFCLIGGVLLFDGDDIAPPRRLFWAGAAFGFAGAVKVWAILVVVAALAAAAGRWRDRIRPLASGLVVGFGLPCLPFVLLAPRAFVHDVIVAQLTRGTSGRAAYSFAQRLSMMLGLDFAPTARGVEQAKWLGMALAVLVLAVVALTVLLRWGTRLDAFVLGAAAAVFVGLLKPPQFYDHYAYFVATFAIIAIGLCAGTVADLVEHLAGGSRGATGFVRRLGAAGIPAIVGALALLAVPLQLDRARSYLAPSADPAATVAAAVPAGSCVVTDMPIILVVADRFGTSSSCDAPLDPFGLWLTDNDGAPPGAKPPYPASFTAEWRSWLEGSDYVVLSVAFSNYIPWDQPMIDWFKANFTLVAEAPRTFVYQHRR